MFDGIPLLSEWSQSRMKISNFYMCQQQEIYHSVVIDSFILSFMIDLFKTSTFQMKRRKKGGGEKEEEEKGEGSINIKQQCLGTNLKMNIAFY